MMTLCRQNGQAAQAINVNPKFPDLISKSKPSASQVRRRINQGLMKKNSQADDEVI
jgi:hypothetical protein